MHQPSGLIADEPSRSSAHSSMDRHCVFSSGGQRFSLPAASVCELRIAQGVVPVPASPAALAGLYRAGGSFLPVVSLRELLQLATVASPQLHESLIIVDRPTPWALLIADAVAVDMLPHRIALDEPLPDPLCSVTAGAAHDDGQLVYMLDPVRLYRFTQQVIDAGWNPSRDRCQIYQPHAGGEH